MLVKTHQLMLYDAILFSANVTYKKYIFHLNPKKNMKINIPPYLKKKPIHSTSEKTYFNDPKDSLSELWDKLAKIYSKSVQTSQASIDTSMLKKINHGLYEANTSLTTLELIDSGVIKSVPVLQSKKPQYNMKRYMIENCLKIIGKCSSLLQSGIDREKEISNRIKEELSSSCGDKRVVKDDNPLFNVNSQDEDSFDEISFFEEIEQCQKEVSNTPDGWTNLPTVIENGEIRLYFNDVDYISMDDSLSFKDNKGWTPKGLLFVLKIHGQMYNFIIEPKIYDKTVQNIYEYFKEKNAVQSYKNSTIEITISEIASFESFMKSHLTNYCKKISVNETYFHTKLGKLANLTVSLLKDGHLLEDIFYFVNLAASRLIVNSVILKYSNYSMINYSCNILEDSYSDYFFIVCGSEVLKVKRFADGFEIFLNEEMVYL